MSAACFFATYLKTPEIPYYMEFYLLELQKQFSKVVFISEHKALSNHAFLAQNQIDFLYAPNQGYDFGQWHEALQATDLSSYDTLALVNDSCVLFKPLDAFMGWSQSSTAQYKGMTENFNFGRHIQSYFLVIEKPAFALVKDYFNRHGKQQSISDVISVYEIGLSKHITENGFTLEAFIPAEKSSGEYSPYFYFAKGYIRKGLPLIKKKIIYSSYREDELLNLARMDFKTDPSIYIGEMKKSGATIDLQRLQNDLPNEFGFFQKLKYAGMVNTVKFVRLFRKQKQR